MAVVPVLVVDAAAAAGVTAVAAVVAVAIVVGAVAGGAALQDSESCVRASGLAGTGRFQIAFPVDRPFNQSRQPTP